MPEFEKTSEQASAATIAAGDEVLGVQSSETVLYTAAQVNTFVHANPPAGIANTVTITSEHQFTEGNELDYSGSFSDGMSATTITFSGLPSTTTGIHVWIDLGDPDTPQFIWKRSGSGTEFTFGGTFAEVGTNRFRTTLWIATNDNTIRATGLNSSNNFSFIIFGYKKTGA